MKLILKYLKPFSLLVVLSLVLLFMQAMTDLSLPNLMSDIVNVGIQQAGIEDKLAQALSQDGLDLITALAKDQDKETFEDSYRLVEPGTQEAEKYLAKYPSLKENSIYIIKTDADLEAIADIYSRSSYAFISLMQGLNSSGHEQTGQQTPTASLTDLDMGDLDKLVEPGTQEAEKYLAKYPSLKENSIYIIKTDADLEAIADIYSRSSYAFISLMQGLNSSGHEQTGQQTPTASLTDLDMGDLDKLV